MATLTSILAQLRSHESAAFSNPYALRPEQNIDYPNSHASGAYQYQPGTWRGYTAASGIGTQYSEAYKAPPQVQDAVTAWVVINKGTGDWTPYSGAVSSLTHVDVTPEELLGRSSGLGGVGAVNFTADPTMSFNPGFTDFTAGTAFSPSLGTDNAPYRTLTGGLDPEQQYDLRNFGVRDFAAGNDFLNPSLGYDPVQDFNARGGLWDDAGSIDGSTVTGILGAGDAIRGLLPGAKDDPSNKWWQILLTNIQDLTIRGGLGLLALVLIAAGAWAFASGSAQEGLARLAKVSK